MNLQIFYRKQSPFRQYIQKKRGDVSSFNYFRPHNLVQIDEKFNVNQNVHYVKLLILVNKGKLSDIKIINYDRSNIL